MVAYTRYVSISNMCWHMLAYASMYSHMLAYANIFSRMLPYANVCDYMQACTHIRARTSICWRFNRIRSLLFLVGKHVVIQNHAAHAQSLTLEACVLDVSLGMACVLLPSASAMACQTGREDTEATLGRQAKVDCHNPIC